MRGLCVLALALTLSPALASAQTAVLLFEPAGSESLRASAGAQATSAVAEGLERAGMVVVDRATALRRLSAAGAEACEAEDCVPAVLTALGADIVVAVAVWADRSTGAPREVALSLIGFGPPMVNASAPVESDVTTAAAVALADALTRWSGAGQANLRIEGTPRGASVTIDSRPAGLLPLASAAPLGQVEVTVSMAGYVSERRTVELIATEGPVVVRFALEREEPTLGEPEAPVASSGRAVVGPVLLGLAGAGAGVALGLELARPGCVERPADGVCLEERVLRNGNVALLSVAAIGALTGAVLWFALSGDDDPQAAAARVGFSPAMLHVSTTF